MCFFQGNVALEKAKRKKPFGWFPDAGWEDCVRLAEVSPECFGSLLDDIERNEKIWKEVGVLVMYQLFQCPVLLQMYFQLRASTIFNYIL